MQLEAEGVVHVTRGLKGVVDVDRVSEGVGENSFWPSSWGMSSLSLSYQLEQSEGVVVRIRRFFAREGEDVVHVAMEGEGVVHVAMEVEGVEHFAVEGEGVVLVTVESEGVVHVAVKGEGLHYLLSISSTAKCFSDLEKNKYFQNQNSSQNICIKVEAYITQS